MKIGDYVRTKDGTIGKIIAIDLAKPRQEQYPNHPSKKYWRDKILISCYRGWRTLQNIKKTSPNIIDLIEVGDYVNGSLVLSIYNEPYGKKEKVLRIERTIPSDSIYGDDCELIYNNEIKSIVTKEQFASMEYKVVK